MKKIIILISFILGACTVSAQSNAVHKIIPVPQNTELIILDTITTDITGEKNKKYYRLKIKVDSNFICISPFEYELLVDEIQRSDVLLSVWHYKNCYFVDVDQDAIRP